MNTMSKEEPLYKKCERCIQKGDSEPKPMIDFLTYRKPFHESSEKNKKREHKLCKKCRAEVDKARKARLKHIEEELLRKSHPIVQLYELTKKAFVSKGMALIYKSYSNKKLEAICWNSFNKELIKATDLLEQLKKCELVDKSLWCKNCYQLPYGTKTYKDEQGESICPECFEELCNRKKKFVLSDG